MTDDAPVPHSTPVPDSALDSTAPSLRVVRAVADAQGVDPTRLDPLFEAIDPSALDRLFEPTGERSAISPGTVTFGYHGYDVTVYSDGSVTLD